jgi:hypothetical protein
MSGSLDLHVDVDEPRLGHNGGPPLDGISEAASEKKRRGRPPRFRTAIATMKVLGAHETDRMIVEHIFAGQALHVLGADDSGKLSGEMAWLNGKMTLLAELGRLLDVDIGIGELAAALCEKRPSVKDAISNIRRWRLSQRGAA